MRNTRSTWSRNWKCFLLKCTRGHVWTIPVISNLVILERWHHHSSLYQSHIQKSVKTNKKEIVILKYMLLYFRICHHSSFCQFLRPSKVVLLVLQVSNFAWILKRRIHHQCLLKCQNAIPILPFIFYVRMVSTIFRSFYFPTWLLFMCIFDS